jgi:phenylalanyl-tRNA synthetase alpha chain
MMSDDQTRHFFQQVEASASLSDLESVRVAGLGKEGFFTAWVKTIASLPPEQRKEEGQRRNQLKNEFVQTLEAKKAVLERAALDQRLEAERVDVTLPCRHEELGRVHPVSQTIDEIIEIFAQWGFVFSDGPSIESDDNNFTKLNIPPDHPARQMQDTFYMPDAEDGSKRVLRTQTSCIQIRTMMAQKPPIRLLAAGPCLSLRT